MPATIHWCHKCSSTQPDCLGHAGDDRTCDHALAFPVGQVKAGVIERCNDSSIRLYLGPQYCWVFFRQHLFCSNEVYFLAGDEVVVTKAGKKTYGLDRFFSSLYGKSLSGLSFFALSLVSLQQRRSFPIRFEQILKTASEKVTPAPEKLAADKPVRKRRAKKSQKLTKTASKAKKESPAIKNRGGRPKGSKNKDKTLVTFTPELLRIQGWIQAVLQQVKGFVPLTYLLLDGHFGNNNALHRARQLNLHLISKLRCDSALHLPYEAPKTGKKSRCKYGEQLKFSHIPAQYLKESTVEEDIKTEIYQAELLHREFARSFECRDSSKDSSDYRRTSAHNFIFKRFKTLLQPGNRLLQSAVSKRI